MLNNIIFKEKKLLMKLSTEEKKTYKWLESNGFSYYDIMHLVKLYNKEGISFEIRSFDKNDFPELREYLRKQEHCSYIDYLLKGLIGVDKEKVKKLLYNG